MTNTYSTRKRHASAIAVSWKDECRQRGLCPLAAFVIRWPSRAKPKLPCAMRWMPPADVYIWPPDMPVPPMRRRCRHSDWNGHFPSSTRTCASTALAPRRPIATVCTVASSAFSSAPRPKTMHRIWCRRRPATMKTCVGPKCLTPKDTACVSARPAANISRRACCRTARSCWKRRPTRTSCRRSVTRSCACWPRKWAWAATIHGARPSMSSTSCPPIAPTRST